jgi:hypothetical protein
VEKTFEEKVKKTIKEYQVQENDPLKIVPKNRNLDLKRNLQRKM